MNMRNATCMLTKTSKVPTRVTLLFIPYTVAMVDPSKYIYTYTCINIAIYQYALNMYMYLATFNSFVLERYV